MKKKYDVEITETLQRTVTVEASSQMEAEQIVEDAWNHQEYVLGAEDFIGANFNMVAEREIPQKQMMDVLLVQPGKFPQPISIEDTLKAKQQIVGGLIEPVYLCNENGIEEAALICNEEGKINGLPLNRALYDSDGNLYDIVAGDFLVVGLSEDNFASLSPELMKKYENRFHYPEAFVQSRTGIHAIPIKYEFSAEPSHDKTEQSEPSHDDEWGER